MTLIEEPRGDRPRLKTEANARLDRHFAKQRADQVEHRRVPPSSEQANLRGIPAIGHGVAGAIRDTRPDTSSEIGF